MFNKVIGFLTGKSNIVKSIETIATEWIETDLESAEAQALKIKTLDPNGFMRRDLSRKVSQLYTLYIIVALLLLVCEAFGLGNTASIAIATEKVTSLFTAITTLFGVIVSASFGVNYSNIKKDK